MLAIKRFWSSEINKLCAITRIRKNSMGANLNFINIWYCLQSFFCFFIFIENLRIFFYVSHRYCTWWYLLCPLFFYSSLVLKCDLFHKLFKSISSSCIKKTPTLKWVYVHNDGASKVKVIHTCHSNPMPYHHYFYNIEKEITIKSLSWPDSM